MRMTNVEADATRSTTMALERLDLQLMKRKELINTGRNGGSNFSFSEKQFLDVQQMVKMTGASKLPSAL